MIALRILALPGRALLWLLALVLILSSIAACAVLCRLSGDARWYRRLEYRVSIWTDWFGRALDGWGWP